MPYITVRDGTKIFCGERGKGNKETIVFAHGLSTDHLGWMPFIKEFVDQYHCVFYDQRGHGQSDCPQNHMTVEWLGRDLHDILEYLELEDVIVLGYSMGVTSIMSYINQYGCDRIKQFVAVDMSPYLRNTADWKGGYGRGEYTHDEFLSDMNAFYDDTAAANFRLMKKYVLPEGMSLEGVGDVVATARQSANTLTFTSLWYADYYTDLRPAVQKITVPMLYMQPSHPLYTDVAVNYYRENVKGSFALVNDITQTTHAILLEKPHEAAEKIKAFLSEK